MALDGDTLQDRCISSGTTDAFGASISEPQSSIMHFVHFFSACSAHIDAPLEEALRQSMELVQFIDTSSSHSFLPHHQMQVRCALWELIRNARVREQCAAEMDKQSRLYGGHFIAFQTNNHTAGPSACNGTGSRPCRASVEHSSAAPLVPSDVPNIGCCRANGHSLGTGSEEEKKKKKKEEKEKEKEDEEEEEEDALLTALRAHGRFLPRAPSHVPHCPRRISSLSLSSFSFSLSHPLPPPPPPPPHHHHHHCSSSSSSALHARLTRDSRSAAAARCVRPATSVTDLTADCALCVAEGLLQAAWIALRCGQLIGVAAAAHLCAAPLRIPREALATTPREAMFIGHHLAQQQLRCAIGLLLTVAQPPAQEEKEKEKEEEKEKEKKKKCNGKEQIGEEDRNMALAERAHNAEVIAAITAMGRAGLDTCVMMLSALRQLEPRSAPLVLLQAAAIAFCDQRGVNKARRILREWCDAQTSHSSDTHTPSCTTTMNDSNGNNTKETSANNKSDSIHNNESDDYTMWLRLDGPEDVATGVLFSVFLQLLSLRESPLHDAASIATACLCARNALDTFVYPRLLILCDAADGAASARGRQTLALHWLVRGTLCHILNALSVAPSSLFPAQRVVIEFDESAPVECARAAAQAASAAREFSTDTLAPSWLDILIEWSEPHIMQPARDGRLLPCGKSVAAAQDHSTEAQEETLCVKEIALLPVPVMRMWFVLATTVFRSASGDLLAADNADNNAASSVLSPIEVAAPTCSGAQSQAAKELAKRENAQRMAEVQRMAEKSSVAFWHRWREAMAPMASSSSSSSYYYYSSSFAFSPSSSSLLSLNDVPVFERQRRLMLFACSEEREEKVTTFMSALRDAHPIAPSSEAAFAAAQLLPRRANKEDEGGEKEKEEYSLAGLDARLDAACRRYDTQCVRPLVDNALQSPLPLPKGRAASGSAMRAVQQKQRLCNAALKSSERGRGHVTRLGAGAGAGAGAAVARKEGHKLKSI